MGQNKCSDVVKEERLILQMRFLKGWGADTPAHLCHPPKVLKLQPSLVQAPCIADAKRWAVSKQDLSHLNTVWRCFSYLQGLKQLDTSVRLHEISSQWWLHLAYQPPRRPRGDFRGAKSKSWLKFSGKPIPYLFIFNAEFPDGVSSIHHLEKKGTGRSKGQSNWV